MAKTRCNLRLMDVHATADVVGREFKELTDRFGMMCVTRLLPPVVEALECLEVYVERYQQLQTRLSEQQLKNDTVDYEREQREILEKKNEELTVAFRALQRQNKSLQMGLDELLSKNEDMSEELKMYQSQGRPIYLESVSLSPHTYFRGTPNSECPSQTFISHNDHSHPSTSPLPPSSQHHNTHLPPHNNSTPAANGDHDASQHSNMSPQDKRWRSTVTGRLNEVERELEKTTHQLQELQQLKAEILAENKELKLQLEHLKAKMSMENTQLSKETTEEVPRYYKEDVMRVLTERNQLKEELHCLQEELEETKDALRLASGGKEVTTTNGVATLPAGGGQASKVRSILTESIDLGSYMFVSDTSPSEMLFAKSQ